MCCSGHFILQVHQLRRRPLRLAAAPQVQRPRLQWLPQASHEGCSGESSTGQNAATLCYINCYVYATHSPMSAHLTSCANMAHVSRRFQGLCDNCMW